MALGLKEARQSMALGEECRSWITDRAVHWKIEIGQISWLLCLWEPNRLGIELLVSHLVVLGGSRPPVKQTDLIFPGFQAARKTGLAGCSDGYHASKEDD